MQIPIPSKFRVQAYDGTGYSMEVAGRQRRQLEMPAQLGLPFYGKTVDIDGMRDAKYGDQIQYMGKATHVFDDKYWCVAAVGGALCAVEVTIRPHDDLPPSSAT